MYTLILSNIQKNNQHHLRESFRSIYLFHQSCATGTLHLRKQIYPRKYSPNLKQVIFFTLLIKIKNNGPGTKVRSRHNKYRAYTTDEQGNIDRKAAQITSCRKHRRPQKTRLRNLRSYHLKKRSRNCRKKRNILRRNILEW